MRNILNVGNQEKHKDNFNNDAFLAVLVFSVGVWVDFFKINRERCFLKFGCMTGKNEFSVNTKFLEGNSQEGQLTLTVSYISWGKHVFQQILVAM